MWHARRRSFGSVAAEYERSRPGYPEKALDWLLGENRARVLDLGAGTGKLTRQLGQRGLDVLAVEPAMEMIRQLEPSTSSVRLVCGTAEHIPVRSNWADVLTSAQAFHWFEPEQALPEIRRVLCDGGVLALLSNLRDESVDWVRALSHIIGSEDAMAATIGDREEFAEDPSHGALSASPLFGEIEHKVFPFEQALTEDEVLALVRSRSYVAVLPNVKRKRVLRAVQTLCRTHQDLAGRETFLLPYKTLAFRVPATVG